MIDHALLHPTLTRDAVRRGLEMAIAFDVASVCVMPCYVDMTAKLLGPTGVKTSTVIGFPLGVTSTATKCAEAKQMLDSGCEELDMVANISAVLSDDWQHVEDDIAAIVEITHAAGQKVKVIFENCYLQDAHKTRLCEICTKLNADWVKTSTGFGTGGATREDLQLMLGSVGGAVQVKAAGGVKTLETLVDYRSLGVTRCGASSTAEILSAARQQLGLPPVQVKADAVEGY
ncbi:MAG: deoxyribose-phosphate aldolase [Planctomycetota bacterium]